MGSKLYVKSVVGKGTTFWFNLELPIIESMITREIERKEKESSRIIGFKGKKRTILLADDNDKNRILLRDILLPLGFEIIEAVNGKEALEKAKELTPDCVLMDLVMPVMDGLEATREIRKIPGIKGTVIIGVSASAIGPKRQISLEAGCDDFLSKPLRIDDLLDLLKRYLRLKWVYDEQSGRFEEDQLEIEGMPWIVPPKKYLKKLLEYAEISHITGLQQELYKIKNSNDQYIPFVSKIEKFINNFQFKDIIKMIQSYLQGDRT
jgi:CheY-like chemotaxis protein